MASAHIQALLAPPSIPDARTKALNALDSKYNSFQDLENDQGFDEFVERERIRNEELRARLENSQSEVDSLIEETKASTQAHLHTAQELSLLRHSLADELSSLSQELVSSVGDPDRKPTLLEDVESMHRSLKELESVKGYVQVIQHALRLSEEAAGTAATGSPLSAVPHYEKLQQFASSVSQTCSPVEDGVGQQTLHLLTFMEGVRAKTWKDIKGVLTSALLDAAEKLQWPNAVDYVAASAGDRKKFESAFLDLLKLQQIGEKLHASNNRPRSDKEGLYPIQALIQPVALRFKYHFETSRQTNRLDKARNPFCLTPEWYFTQILNVAHDQRPFLEAVAQHLLNTTKYRSYNAWREFTLLLFPLLARKLSRTVPSLISHPPVLAHTIYQALAFDSAIREEGFELDGTSAAVSDDKTADGSTEVDGNWKGITEVILGKKEWFEAWMEGERKFAMDQYMEIISAPDAWQIADDDPNDEDNGIDKELKPTNSARRVKALVEQVTDRYSPLPQFTHRTRFLITVQLPLLESYHDRISSSLDAFETLSSSLMRAVPGALSSSVGASSSTTGDTRHLTSGIEGTQRLCKALASARYVAAAMEAWGEDLFFLELWTEINHKSSLRSRAEASASLPQTKRADAEVPEGTIFEELVVQYGKLAERAEDLVIQTVCGEVETSLKSHFTSGGSAQTTPASASPEHELVISPTLLGPMAQLSSHLTFLQSTLPQATVTNLYRQVASRLSTHLLQREITFRGRTKLTPQQGKIIMAECELWAETCRLVLSRAGIARAEAPWRPLLQAGRIVGVEGDEFQRISDATFGATEDQDWEKTLIDIVGLSELSREEVGQILHSRADV